MAGQHDLLERLAKSANPTGGWGYYPHQADHLEPTCLALLALSKARHQYAEVIIKGRSALEANRLDDGSYRLQRGRPQAIWTTALVLFTKIALGDKPSDLQQTIDCIVNASGRVVEADPEVDDMTNINLQLVGWPWGEGTFSWVEPTAWACLALRAAGLGSHPRIIEGCRLLVDRAFESGGINYGNRIILGKPTEPIPGPTALMLLALQGSESHPRIDAAKGYLRMQAERSTDLEHLGWMSIALNCHAVDSETRATLEILQQKLRDNLEHEAETSLQGTIGPFRLALAAIALQESNPFAMPNAEPMIWNDTPTNVTHIQPSGKRSFGDKLRSKALGFFVNGLTALRALPPTSPVHIVKADDYEQPLTDLLMEQFKHFREAVPLQGKRVVLKPNLVEYHRNKVINTDIRFIDAVIELCQREGAAEIIVAEGPGHWRNVEFLVQESGLGDVLKKRGVRFVDINHDEPVKTMNMGRATGLDSLYLSRTILESEVLISLPKLKTHHWAVATLSLKNLFGTLPGICYGWPKNELHWRGIPNSIIDIALTHTPQLAIVDGIVGMDGDGPLNGNARHCGAMIMGTDLVAVDATCCRLMGIPPERVPTLMLGVLKRLGRMDEAFIPQLGVPIAELRQEFELPPGSDKIMIELQETASSS